MLNLRFSLLRLGGKTYGGCLPDASKMSLSCLQFPPNLRCVAEALADISL
jgi:hypothetical protein